MKKLLFFLLLSIGNFTAVSYAQMPCDSLLYSDGVYFYPAAADTAGYTVYAIDNDSNTVHSSLVPYGITSEWQVFSEVVGPGDTNLYLAATSYFDVPAAADNWLMFGGTTIPTAGATLEWQHLFWDNLYRDGYEVVINTVGNTINDFINSGTVLKTFTDNDPLTDGDTVWASQSVNIDGLTYGGQKVYIAFHHNAFDMFFLALDNFLIKDCNVPCPAILLSASLTNPTACTSSNGTIAVTPSGGASPYTYLWNNAQTSSSATGLGAGTFIVTATDIYGCTADSSFTLVLPAGPAVSVSSTDETGAGANDGTATATPSGGASPYTYIWSNSGTIATIANLPPGTYSVTVTDAGGCTGTGLVVVNAFSAPACDTLLYSDGVYFFPAAADTAGFTVYAIDNDSNAVHSSLVPYGITSEWQVFSEVVGPGDTNLYLAATSYFNTPAAADNWLMFGGTTIPATGATLAWQHIFWDNGYRDGYEVIINTVGNTMNDFINSGTVLKTFADNDPATNGDTVWANQSVLIDSSAFVGQKVYIAFHHNAFDMFFLGLDNFLIESCNVPCPTISLTAALSGSTTCSPANGSISVTPAGGATPYTYLWSNSQTTATATGLGAGLFSVTVTDVNGCVGDSSFTLNLPSGPSVSVSSTDETSPGANDGSATATPSGGTTPYTYLWSNSGTTATIASLPPGTYSVTVTDAGGCTGTGSAVVNASVAPVCDTLLYSDGVYFFPAAADTAGFTVYAIDNDSNAVHSSLAPYGITSEWQVFSEVVSPGDTNLYLAATSYFDVPATADNWLMFGGTTIPAAGATLEWQHIFWDNGYRDGYEVIINTVGNTINDFINSGTVLKTFADNDPATNGDTVWASQTANISAITYGGQKVYIAFHHNAFDMFFLGLDNFLIESCSVPCAVISLSATMTNPTSCSSANGSISVTPSGGGTPYSYLWSNSQTTATATGLAAGIFGITVTDANGCSSDSSFTLNSPSGMTVTVSSTDETSPGANNGTASASVTGGTSPYSYNWSNGPTTSSVSNLAPGTYTVTITDAGGCTSFGTVTINPFNCTLGVSATATPESSPGGNNGTAGALATGGSSPYSYNWSNGSTGLTITGLAPGNYTVTVTDASGCTSSATVVVDSFSCALVVTVTATGETAIGASDGTATVSPSGGTSPFIYQWSNGGTSQTITGLSAGSYTVTVTDVNNCNSVGTGTVNPPNFCNIVISNVSVTNPSCSGSSDGQITVTTSGGTGTVTLAWSDGNTGNTAYSLAAGTYTVTVSDINNCTADTTVTLTQPAPLTGTVSHTNETCAGCNNGSASVSVAGGTPPYSYNWTNGQTGPVITNLAAGIYSVFVQDANGCLFQGSDTVQPAVLETDDLTAFNLQFSVFPNPNEGKFILRISSGYHPGPVAVTIRNIIGENVFYARYSVYGNPLIIDITDRPGGVYFVEVESGPVRMTRKMVSVK